MKIRATVATTQPLEVMGEAHQITRQRLRQMCAAAPGVSICADFNQDQVIGVVLSAHVRANTLVVDAELCIDALPGKFLVPGVVIPSFSVFCFGTTDHPCNHTLPPIEIIEEVQHACM